MAKPKTQHPAIKSIASSDPTASEITAAAAAEPIPYGPGHWAWTPPAPDAAPGSAALLHRQIRPDPANPRKDFDPEGLKELEATIVHDGLIENLVVRPLKGVTTPEGLQVFMLIAGERRWQAIGLAIGHKTWPVDRPIDCSVKDVDEPTARRLALVENLQRRDLKPVEEARALEALIELTGTTAAEIGRQLGFSERWAQQRMSLLKLPEKMQARVEAGDLNVEDARKAVTLLPQLSAIKAAELANGKLSVADAKRWVDNQPKALDRKPGEWLIVLEILDAIARAGKEASKVICGLPGKDVERLHGYPHYLIAVYPQTQDGHNTGLAEASISYNCSQRLRLRFGEEGLDKRERPRWDLIMRLRKESGIKEPELSRPPGTYVTPWLNGPFEIAPEVVALIEDARTERQAAMERRATAEADARKRVGEAFNQVQSIEAAIRKALPAAADARIVDALAAFGITLPVHVAKDGSVNDAGGQTVLHCGYHPSNVPTSLLAKNRLIALALNTAAGLATPEKPPSEVDEAVLPRAEFLRVVADILLEDCSDDLPDDDDLALFEATARAGRGLDAFLAQESIEYGDAEYDWEEGGAMALAEGIRVDGLGAQVDLEEAIATAEPAPADAPAAGEGEEFSPALLALAGGRPREVAP